MCAARFSECRTKSFKKDFSDLCDTCPLRNTLPKAIDDQIREQALHQVECFPESIYRQWFETQFKSASEAMDRMVVQSFKEGTHLGGVTEIYIWNKMRAQALRSILADLQRGTDKLFKGKAKSYLVKERTLKELLQREPGPSAYEEVARLLPKLKGKKGERSGKDVGRERPKYLDGKVTFKKARIEPIVNDLHREGGEIMDEVLLQRVRQFGT